MALRGLATACGVIRNEFGEWIGGFAANLGVAMAHVAELWGVIHALELAWDKGCRRVEVEMDSTLVMGPTLRKDWKGCIHSLA